MTKERIVKELSKVREQLAGLQARERDLAEQLQMAEDGKTAVREQAGREKENEMERR